MAILFTEDWLNSDSNKIILIENEFYDGTQKRVFYWGNYPYVASPHDFGVNSLGEKIVNVSYWDILENIPSITSSVDSNDVIGTISVLNPDGDLDPMMFEAWMGHKIRIYMGSPEWWRGDFGLIFDGILDGISSSNQATIQIKVKDRQEILEVPAQTNLITASYIQDILDNTTQFTANIPEVIYKSNISPYTTITIPVTSWSPATPSIPEGVVDRQIPICLGKVFNIEPVLIDAFNHVYIIHEKSIVSVDAVRSNGVVLDGPGTANPQYEVDLSIEKDNLFIGAAIRLLVHDQSTQITCDVTGEAQRGLGYDINYTNTIHSSIRLIEWLILEKTTMTKDNLCPVCFAAGFSNISEVGIYITSDISVHNIIEQITNTVGAFHKLNRLGLLQVVLLESPSKKTPDFLINTDNIIHKQLTLGALEPPIKSTKLGYKRNYTLQDKAGIAGIILEADSLETLNTFTNEYTELVLQNTADILNHYPLSKDGDLIPTLFFNKVDAETEIARRLDIRSKMRYIFKIQTTNSPFLYSLGDIVKVTYPRYLFKQGALGVIVGMQEFPTKNKVNLEVWL